MCYYSRKVAEDESICDLPKSSLNFLQLPSNGFFHSARLDVCEPSSAFGFAQAFHVLHAAGSRYWQIFPTPFAFYRVIGILPNILDLAFGIYAELFAYLSHRNEYGLLSHNDYGDVDAEWLDYHRIVFDAF